MRDSEPVNSGDPSRADCENTEEFERVAGFDALSRSTLKCIKGVLWKDTPAHYFLNNIEENLVLERQLQNGKYKQKKPKKFKVYYPKERDIVSVHFRDRVFQRSLNDNILYPKISRSFIYDNMACQKGKGPDLARESEKRIWEFLWERIGNAFGVAGLMGNLYAESALNPQNLQNTYEKKLGMTDASYTAAVDNGTYTNFVKDAAGYGLAQWTYWSRKQNLLNFAKEKGSSIGDLEMQLEFLWKELGSYTTVLKALIGAKSVQEASDVVLTKFEKPANQGDSVKMARAKYGQKYYDQFAVLPVESTTGEKEDNSMSYDPKKVIQVAEGEVGYLEKKSNSNLDDKTANAGDKNYTKYARDLDALGFYNGKKQSVAWCDIFVDWCFVKAYGLEAALKLTNQPLGKSNCGAGCKYSRNYYKKINRLFDKPEPGDQVFFWPKDGIGGTAIQHTGLVYAVDGTYVYTIEGNTSGANGVIANGGGVCKKKYKLTYNRLAGFGRPDYGMAAVTTPAATTETKTETKVETAAPATSASGKVVVITANSLNARVGDSQKFDSVGYVQKGEKYEWVATSPVTGWHAIRMAKRICWVSPNYSKVEAA